MMDNESALLSGRQMNNAIRSFLRRLARDGFRNEQGYQSEEVLTSSPEVQALSDAADAWEQTEGRDNGVHSGNGV